MTKFVCTPTLQEYEKLKQDYAYAVDILKFYARVGNWVYHRSEKDEHLHSAIAEDMGEKASKCLVELGEDE